ncbi:peptide/nickel transport system permease protein [Paenibacillus algorifonticola]|uniref:Peptide/nickel transport system permease protein n=1 Tax=Paenibacillus algorifonticola TaxID=684063 RepID=A0A1I2BXY6_9BACL|nr:ABC transporter permease [Paenibacillus algorifonticola]SFE61046.1 peptide/nickel transport system permease protein [Paenibacillus algorifonticola]
MGIYIYRTLLQIVPVLFIITLIVFILVHVTGDPVAMMLPDTASAEDREILTQALGLDRPLYVQYYIFLSNLLQGDFGNSFRYGEAALPIVLERLPASFELAAASMLVACCIAIPFGIWSAVKRNSVFDLFISGVSVLGKAMPSFWVGIMLILIVAVQMGWTPVSGRGGFSYLILPAITLGTGIAAEMTRLVRSSMLEIIGQDYIRTARSKGLREMIVINKHALRNALIPVVTITGLQLTNLVGGSLVVETVFSWPGMGQLIVQAINSHDMAIVQASVFVIALMVILINLATDIAYRALDPRIKYNR